MKILFKPILAIVGLVILSEPGISQVKAIDSTNWYLDLHNSRLLGKWKLLHIKTDAAPFIPDRNYSLEIFRHNIIFDRDTGRCYTDSFTIDGKEIVLYNITCKSQQSKRKGPIGNWISYSGKYWFEEELLYLNERDTWMVYVLRKQ
jgi:hypothetical protein